MELLIIKDGHVFARANDEKTTASTEYSLMQVDELPAYPTEDAGRGKYWEIDLVDGVPAWVVKGRQLTTDEKVEQMQAGLNALNAELHAWKVGVPVLVGQEVYYNGAWYTVLQQHTTQSDWTPDIVPALYALKA